MAFVCITRVKIKSIRHFLPFLLSNERVLKQLLRSKGYKKGVEMIDRNLVFWTLTIWDNEEVMMSFKLSPAHKKAMPNVSKWCNEGSFVAWWQESDAFPEWKQASQKLITEGKLMRLTNPTPRHTANKFPMVQWTFLQRKLFK